MTPSSLSLVSSVFDRANSVAAIAAASFDDFFTVRRISIRVLCGQSFLRDLGGLVPQVRNDGVDFRHVSLVPIDTILDAAVVGVVPELRHASLGLEVLRICEPFLNP